MRADAILGPASIRNIHLVIDPLTSSGSATGQLHIAGSAASAIAPEAGLSAEAACVIPVGEAPVPVEGDVFGGIRLTFQLSGPRECR